MKTHASHSVFRRNSAAAPACALALFALSGCGEPAGSLSVLDAGNAGEANAGNAAGANAGNAGGANAGRGSAAGTATLPPVAGASAEAGSAGAGGSTAGAGGSTAGAGGSAAGAGGSAAGAGPQPDPVVPVVTDEECAPSESAWAVSRLSTTRVSEMGTPFDADEADTIGPADWNSNYGKSPELIAAPFGGGFDVLWQDTTAEPPRGFVVRAELDAGGYTIRYAYEVALLDRIMGFARDAEGNYYYATGVDEEADITTAYPPPDTHRSDIVRVVKFNPSGCLLMEADVDMARQQKDPGSEPLVNPMTAGSSRLAVGGGQLALLHSINTAPDANDVRHQKAAMTHFDAVTGEATRTDTLWVSHSFDQRLQWDGSGFVEMHLGDAYPRYVVLGRFTDSTSTEGYGLFAPKGPEGDNATYTQLGALVPIPGGDYGFMAVFATDRSAALATEEWQSLVGTRDVAMVRVRRDFDEHPAGENLFFDEIGEVLTVESSGKTVDNPLFWLTDYAQETEAETHAARVRAAALSSDRYVVLWERWVQEGDRESFEGTYALELDAGGAVTTATARVSDSHIPRGDDAFSVNGYAALVLGSAAERSLRVQLTGPGLQTHTVALP